MDDMKFIYAAAQLSASAQKELIERIGAFCTPEEVTALLTGIGYIRMLSDEKLKKAMMDAVREELFNI